MEGWTHFNAETNLTEIAIGNSLGIKFLYSVESIFFEQINETCNTSFGSIMHPITLRQDYMQQWNNMLPLFDELYYINQSIFGFFVGDELVWNGLDPIQLNIAVQLIRNTYNNSTIFTNAAAPAIQYGITACGKQYSYTKISTYLDWFSVDIYHSNGSDPNCMYFRKCI